MAINMDINFLCKLLLPMILVDQTKSTKQVLFMSKLSPYLMKGVLFGNRAFSI